MPTKKSIICIIFFCNVRDCKKQKKIYDKGDCNNINIHRSKFYVKLRFSFYFSNLCLRCIKKAIKAFAKVRKTVYLCNRNRYIRIIYRMNKRLRFISGIFLIVLFISYYGCTTAFVHTHHTPYGLITHSHPYKGPHSHSAPAFMTISILSKILFCTTSIIFISVFLHFIKAIKVICYQFHIFKHLQQQFLRAPPILCFYK